LRKGVKFQDGTDFTSEAVKMEGDLVISTQESNSLTWDRWEIIDPYTVRLYLKEYLNDFWTNLSGINMTFFSPTAYKANQPNGQAYIKQHPIGTGPFKFVSFEKDVSMKFVKNDNYWQAGKPYLDGIEFITVKEPLTQQAAIQSGAGDMLALVQGKILDDMKKKGFVINARYGGTDFLLFDTMNAGSIYNNIKVRQAIEYAIDKEAMAKTLGYGFLIANNQMPPPEGNPAYNPKIGKRDYDPAKAKALLKEAGYPNGFKAKMISMGPSVPPKDLSIQEYMKAVGINLELDLVDNQTFWNYMMNGWKDEMVSTGYAVGPNFPAWLKQYFPPTGVFDKSARLPDQVIAKITPALKEPDPAKAKALSDELIQLIYDDTSIIPIYSNAMGFILSPRVHDSNSNTLKWFDWSVWEPENTWLSK
jgi:ABC-type transport system substrate-binding protein